MIAAKLMELAAAFGVVDVAAAPVIGIILAIAAACAVGFAAGWELAKNWDDICEAAGRMADSVRDAYNNLMSFNDNLKNNVNGAINDIANYFASLPGRIINALKDAVQAIKEEFKNMINNAKKSGADFVSGFIDGIKSKVQKLINQVKEIAETIEEYLGFSCPDKGALSKYETWMPDFMMGLAKGINQNKGIVTRAIASLSKDMALPLDANASMNMALAGADSGSVSVGGTSMNVYVDHINDLQDLIRIQNQAQQRYRMGAR
jgi:gas vesicle protein